IGLGCGIMTNGFPYRGATGFAGEFGLFPSDATDGQPADQGFSGLSDHVSLFQLCARLKDQGYGAVRLEDLEDLCAGGNPFIESWLDRATDRLFRPIAALQCLLDPQAILLGGPAPQVLVEALLSRLDERYSGIPDQRLIPPTLLPATSGKDAAALGAAVLPVYEALSAHPDAFLNRPAGRAAPLGAGEFSS
ncbi:MAG: ROK family protein, partial [Rhodospirillales bacterium]|nr:ROK family protein [Rhodospirillales bacterium]